jgi:hypothetical protein
MVFLVRHRGAIPGSSSRTDISGQMAKLEIPTRKWLDLHAGGNVDGSRFNRGRTSIKSSLGVSDGMQRCCLCICPKEPP